jgi:hypothetical protein
LTLFFGGNLTLIRNGGFLLWIRLKNSNLMAS